MTITRAELPTLKRLYPHVDDVQDWRAQQTIRLLWDRIWALEGRLQQLDTDVGDLVAASNAQEDQLTQVDRKADEALAIAQQPEEAAEPESVAGSGPLVWAWVDRGGPAVDSPYDPTGPLTDSDYKTYLFGTVLGVTEGDPADDWFDVLTASGIPTGLAIGVVPDNTMPFYAMTQQIGAGGVRGRVFLPTSTADAIGYYAHPFDVLASG